MLQSCITETLMLRYFFFSALAALSIVQTAAHADDRAAAEELLANCEQTFSLIQSFRLEIVRKHWNNEDVNAEPDQQVNETAVHHDFRWRVRNHLQFKPRQVAGPQPLPRVGIEYRFDEFLGVHQGLSVQWTYPAGDPDKVDGLMVVLTGVPKGGPYPLTGFTEVLFGRVVGDARQPLWKVMREAETLELLPDVRLVDGHSTRVLRSQGTFGIHTVCLDPEFGCLPRSIEIQKQIGNVFEAMQLGVEQDPAARLPEAQKARLKALGALQPKYTLTEVTCLIDNIQIDRRQERLVITAFDCLQTRTVKTGEKTDQHKEHVEYRTQGFDLDPDNWPANIFENSVEIPEGTRVLSPEKQGGYVWKNGKVE